MYYSIQPKENTYLYISVPFSCTVYIIQNRKYLTALKEILLVHGLRRTNRKRRNMSNKNYAYSFGGKNDRIQQFLERSPVSVPKCFND